MAISFIKLNVPYRLLDSTADTYVMVDRVTSKDIDVNTFVPKLSEVFFFPVENGYRAIKIGDGENTLADLPFAGSADAADLAERIAALEEDSYGLTKEDSIIYLTKNGEKVGHGVVDTSGGGGVDLTLNPDSILKLTDGLLDTPLMAATATGAIVIFPDQTISNLTSFIAHDVAEVGPIAKETGSLVAGRAAVAESANTIAIGTDVVAGVKGYNWSAIDVEAKTITITTTTAHDWQVGDILSIVLTDSVYTLCSKITGFNSSNRNIISVDAFPFTSATAAAASSAISNTVYAVALTGEDPDHLSITTRSGDIDVGMGAIALGADNTVTGVLGTATGINNIQAGPYGFVTGSSNKGGYASITGGSWNTDLGTQNLTSGRHNSISATGKGNIVGGKDNTVSNVYNIVGGNENNVSNSQNIVSGNKNTVDGPLNAVFGGDNNTNGNKYTLISGRGLKATGYYQIVTGRYNNTKAADNSSLSSAAIIVGNGSTSNPATTFSVGLNGKVITASDLVSTAGNISASNGKITTKTGQITDTLIVGGSGTSLTGDYTLSVGQANKDNAKNEVALVGNHLAATSAYQTVLGKYNNPNGADARPLVIGWGDATTAKDILEVSSYGTLHAASNIKADESLYFKKYVSSEAKGITGTQFVNVSNPDAGYVTVGAEILNNDGTTAGYRMLNIVQGQTYNGDNMTAPNIVGSYNAVFGQLRDKPRDLATPGANETIWMQHPETKKVRQLAYGSTAYNQSVTEGYVRIAPSISGDYNLVTGDMTGVEIQGHWNALLGSGGNNKLYAAVEYDEELDKYVNDPARHNLVVGSGNILRGTENALVLGQLNDIGNLPRANAMGKGLIPTRGDSLVVGTFNEFQSPEGDTRSNVIFNVGNGTDDEHRSSALMVWKQGTVSVGCNPKAPMDVVTLGFLRTELNKIGTNCSCEDIAYSTLSAKLNYSLEPVYVLSKTGILNNTGMQADSYSIQATFAQQTDSVNDNTPTYVLNTTVSSISNFNLVNALITSRGAANIERGIYNVTVNITATGRVIAGKHTATKTQTDINIATGSFGCSECPASYSTQAAANNCANTVACPGFKTPTFGITLNSSGGWVLRQSSGTPVGYEATINKYYNGTKLSGSSTVTKAAGSTPATGYITFSESGTYKVEAKITYYVKSTDEVSGSTTVNTSITYTKPAASDTYCPHCEERNNIQCSDSGDGDWYCGECGCRFDNYGNITDHCNEGGTTDDICTSQDSTCSNPDLEYGDYEITCRNCGGSFKYTCEYCGREVGYHMDLDSYHEENSCGDQCYQCLQEKPCGTYIHIDTYGDVWYCSDCAYANDNY